MSAHVPANDPIALALDVLRSRSGFLTMRAVFYGTHRFDDLQRYLAVTPASLAARLKALVDEGLLRRVPYQEQGQRTRHEYRLSEKGASLLPVLVALADWGNQHLSAGDERLLFTHVDCGEVATAEVRCRAGHAVPLRELRTARTGLAVDLET